MSVSTSQPNVTGTRPWWSFIGGSIPGVGSYLVNVASLNLIVQAKDMSIPHHGVPLAFERSFNSMSGHNYSNTDESGIGQYGNGWTNTFDVHIALNSTGGISVFAADGSRYDYALPAGSTGLSAPQQLVPPIGMEGTSLITYTGGVYFWTQKSGQTDEFYGLYNSPSEAAYNGRLYNIFGRNSSASLQLSYSWDNGDASTSKHLNTLTVTTDGSVNAVTLAYGDFSMASGGTARLLEGLIYPDGKTEVTYTYDVYGNLATVNEPGNNALPQLGQQYGTTSEANGVTAFYVTDARYSHTGSDGGYIAFDMSSASSTESNFTVAGIQEFADVNFTPSDGTGMVLQSAPPTGIQQYRYITYRGGSTYHAFQDTDGHLMFYYYDSLGRVTETNTYGNGSYLPSYFTWSQANDLLSATDPRGNETDYAYDANHNNIAIAEPAVATSAGTLRPLQLFSYDAYNNLVAYCDQASNANVRSWSTSYGGSDSLCPLAASGVTTYTYSAQQPLYPTEPSIAEPYGELTKVTTPLGYHVSITYSAQAQSGSDFGLPTSLTGDAITQADGTMRTPSQSFTYDQRGNVTAVNSGSGSTILAYDTLGDNTIFTDPDGVTSYQTFYADGDLATTQTMSQHANGISTALLYDLDRNLISSSHHYGCTSASSCVAGTATYWYDGADRLVEVKHPTSASEPAWLERYLYDLSSGAGVGSDGVTFQAHGNLYLTQKNHLSGGFISERFQSYDALDRVVSSYTFAPCPFVNGSSGQIFCANAPVATTNAYDSGNNLGLLTSTVNPLGESATYAYDADGRATAIQYAGDGGVTGARSFTYDPDGRATTLAMGTSTVSYQYNSLGRPIAQTDPFGLQSTLSYYADGHVRSLNVQSLGGLAVNYSYRTDGLIQTKAFAYPGVANKLSYAFTSAGRFSALSDFSTQQSQRAAYDLYGRLSSYGIAAGTYTGFGYDLEDRIASYGAYGGETITNEYGVRGDLLAQSFSPNLALSGGGNQWPSFAYTSSQGVLVQSSSEQWDARSGAVIGFTNTGVSYGYDTASRLTSIAQGTTIRDLHYDAENRQIAGAVTNLAATTSACSPGREASGTGVTAYTWGPDNEVEVAQGSVLGSVVFENRHYILGQLLYQAVEAAPTAQITRAQPNGTEDPIQALHVGRDSTIGISGSQGQLAVNDFDIAGALTSVHNATGHAAWNVPNFYLQPCSPQTSVPPASAGYTPIASDGMTEPAPGLLYDQSNYIDSASAQIISPVTLSATTASGGIFASGAARQPLDTHCFDAGTCNPSCPGTVDSCNHPIPVDPGGSGYGGGGFGAGGGSQSGCQISGICHGSSPGGGNGAGGVGAGIGQPVRLAADWDPGSIAALNALGYTASFGNAALEGTLQLGMVFVPGFGDVVGVAEVAAEGAEVATTTVGRYMSQAELDAMRTSGRVQESFNNGVTSVTVPPNPGLYRAASTTDIFTQFDVPTSSLNGVGTGTAKIYGPNSIFGPRLGITEMPPATNIEVP